MTQKRIAPYGSWKSPITATAIASESFGLAQVAIDGDDLYWTETRPWEGGRSVIVRQSEDGQMSDVTPAGFNVRNRVHEYGGGAFTVRMTAWCTSLTTPTSGCTRTSPVKPQLP